MTDDNILTNSDLKNIARMEQLLRSQGYVRNQHGFWITPEQALLAAKAGPPTVEDIEDE